MPSSTHASDGDAELIAFLQRLFGYALTGSTREHALVLLRHRRQRQDACSRRDRRHARRLSPHRADRDVHRHATATGIRPTSPGLRGARLVTAVETEEGRRWAEAQIKALTGGDAIAARFMRQDFFEYTPQFKLIIAGNHKPGLRSVDEAIRRRFHLMPFTVTIPPEERDRELADKLKAEWPGILAWMIEGCLEWQQHGLAPPEAVTDATAAYLEAQDAIAAWIDECMRARPERLGAFGRAVRELDQMGDRSRRPRRHALPVSSMRSKLEALSPASAREVAVSWAFLLRAQTTRTPIGTGEHPAPGHLGHLNLY